ncbi:CDP-glycerol glycerophosphotransferase family protein [Senimuribacter intestinalis]|uniref:CDP-glycerol glycerophosphotransferase family protein n=1 Tax=Senimuribacter intestinalis TaxID=2941507 RepID=UPI00203DDAC8|nr:CDP-glycerol glycerophosphotransferase family protein [Senimuribacter intestinalis]
MELVKSICDYLQRWSNVVNYYGILVGEMMTLIIKFGKCCLGILYCLLKVFPTQKHKVLFLSRQSDELSLDFSMLKDSLLAADASVKIVSICNRLDDSKSGIVGFGIDTLRSMYHLATSKVCVLDAYWPAVSILHHKKSLTVIQMWHALGKIKKSGYQTLGKESGRGEKLARLLNMHENYDYIIAGGSAWNPYYCASFNTTENKLVNIGLPRIDYLLETAQANREKVLAAYPQMKEKQVILYAPTFRRGIDLKWEPLLDVIDFDRYILVIKGHPNQEIICDYEGVLLCPEFKSVELLAACDYLITDYSAIAVEGAILNKKTYYYLYDYEEYTEKNGINVSPFESMPGCAFKDAKALIEDLQGGAYNEKALADYREKYLPRELGTSTAKLTQLVLAQLQ